MANSIFEYISELSIKRVFYPNLDGKTLSVPNFNPRAKVRETKIKMKIKVGLHV
jgi:hypothetical protein